MFEYKYLRERNNFGWDILNINRVENVVIDGVTIDKQVSLATEVSNTINKACNICCAADCCSIIFEHELTTIEKNLLDTTVKNHKNNV